MHTAYSDSDEQRELIACKAALIDGSRTFLAASRLLPSEVANAASAIYAFCRAADDLVDQPNAGAFAVEGMRDRLQLIYLGRPVDLPADRAFARVIKRYNIPRELPDALLDGFSWDAAGRRYATLDDLYDYAARVAGSVGAMMSLIMGGRSAHGLSRACELGVAMQLSNIARDVGEDARMGRLYLPTEWLLDVGINPRNWLAEPVFDDRLASVVKRLLAEAESLYQRASPGIATLPLGCRASIGVARALYREIGRAVARRGFDSVSRRATVSTFRKITSGAPALFAVVPRRRHLHDDPLPANQFLVDAVIATTPLAQRAKRESRTEWVLTLFERLERRDRAARAF